MNVNNRTAGVLFGIMLLILSLFAVWFRFVPDSIGGMPAGMAFDSTVSATGLNGSVGSGFLQVPLWLGVALGIASLLLQLTNLRGITTVPVFAILLLATLSAAQIAVAFCVGLFGSSPGIGPLIATAGLVIGIVAGRLPPE